MNIASHSLSLGLNLVDGCLIAPAPSDPDDDLLHQFKEVVVKKAYAESIRRVVIDVSSVQILDSVCFKILVECVKMLSLLGVNVVVVGFQPGVVSALVDFDVKIDDIVGARTLEDGLDLLRSMTSPEPSEDDPEENRNESEEEIGTLAAKEGEKLMSGLPAEGDDGDYRIPVNQQEP